MRSGVSSSLLLPTEMPRQLIVIQLTIALWPQCVTSDSLEQRPSDLTNLTTRPNHEIYYPGSSSSFTEQLRIESSERTPERRNRIGNQAVFHYNAFQHCAPFEEVVLKK